MIMETDVIPKSGKSTRLSIKTVMIKYTQSSPKFQRNIARNFNYKSGNFNKQRLKCLYSIKMSYILSKLHLPKIPVIALYVNILVITSNINYASGDNNDNQNYYQSQNMSI